MSGLLLLAIAAELVAELVGTVAMLRRLDQDRRDQRRVTFRLSFPPDLTFAAVLSFVRTLTQLSPTRDLLAGHDSAAFEVIASSTGIEHRVQLPAAASEAILAQLGLISGLGVEEIDEIANITLPAATQLRLTSRYRTLRTDDPESADAALLAAIGHLEPDEHLIWQVVARPAGSALWPPKPDGTRTQAAPNLPFWPLMGPNYPASAADWKLKTSEPLFAATLRIGARSGDLSRAKALVRRVQAVLHILRRPGLALVAQKLPASFVSPAMRRARTELVPGSLLNAAELVVLLGWPIGNPALEQHRNGKRR